MASDIIGVIVWSERPKEVADFYSGKLGLVPVSERGDFTAFEPHPGFRFSIGGLHPDVKGPNKDSSRIMLNFSTSDIFADYSRLSELDIPFIRSPEKESWGGWIATFLDLDGNTVQLMQISE
jgi:predicted enzyme related to lactoylglutathione lyase